MTNIEQGGPKDKTNTDAKKKKERMERGNTARELEKATKEAMETAARAFLKE
jgi:hypothetical protein